MNQISLNPSMTFYKKSLITKKTLDSERLNMKTLRRVTTDKNIVVPILSESDVKKVY